MNDGVATALLAYVILSIMSLIVAGMIVVVRRALAPRGRANGELQKGQV